MGYLTAFLNSKLFRFAFKDCFPELLGDTRELSKVFFENVTVKTVDEATEMIFGGLVEQIQSLKQTGKPTAKLEAEVEQRLAELYSLTETEQAIIGS